MATYFIKNGGNDGLDGLSDGNAWATLAKISSHGAFSAGDTISLKRGSLWRENCPQPAGGISGNHITINDYSAGNKPSVRGSNTYNSTGNWSNSLGGNLWYASSITTDPAVFYHDSLPGARKLSQGALATQWDFFYDSGNTRLIVYSAGNPASAASLLEIAIRNNLLGWNTNAFISYVNIDARHNAYAASDCMVSGYWATGGVLNFTTCDFTGCAKEGIYYGQGSGGTVSGCTFTDWAWLNGAQPLEGYAITSINSGGGATVATDVTDCTFTINNINTIETSCFMCDTNGWIRNVQRNTFVNNGRSPRDAFSWWQLNGSATSVLVEDNRIYGAGTLGMGMGISFAGINNANPTCAITIRRNLVRDTCRTFSDTSWGGGDDLAAIRFSGMGSGQTVLIYDNIVDTTYDGGANKNHGILIQSGMGSLTIAHNTVYAAHDGIAFDNSAATVTSLRNNIVFGNRRYGINNTNSSTFTNRGYNSAYLNTTSAWNGISATTGDTTADPGVTNVVGHDFSINNTGAVYHAGVAADSITTDYSSVNFATPPSIGALEYVAPTINALRNVKARRRGG